MNDATQPERLPLTSLDISTEKQERLRQCLAAAFPEITAEETIDLDQLRRILGEWVEPDRERFGLTWPGKAACMKVVQAPSVGTLKPCQDESVDWDTTGNVFIEGDNLEVLKLLQKAYFGKIKMIYIDPPYNTGGDFIYPDKFSETLDTYLEYTGQKDSEGRKFSTNTDSSGRFHSRWLNMMYPRLYLCKNLLKQDGAIFVSIDDNEASNLKKVCDEIFGEENFIANMIWEGAFKNDARQVGTNHEYVLVYAKNRLELPASWSVRKEAADEVLREVARIKKECGEDYQKASEEMAGWFRANKAKPVFAHRRFRNIDARGAYKEDDPTAPGGRKFELRNPKTGDVFPLRNNRGWAFDQETFNKLIDEGRISFISPTSVMVRRYFHETDRVTPQSVFYQPARSASERLSRLLGENVFEFPKDEEIIRQFVEMAATGEADIVLDFFAGSATTAHAVCEQNLADGGSRTFIMVQLPELCDRKSSAARAGYKSVSEIARERVRRIGREIKEKNPGYAGDVGFRSLKLAPSCFRLWDGDAKGLSDADLVDRIAIHEGHLDPSATQDDVLFEVILKDGFSLTVPITQLQLAGKSVFSIADGALLICLDKELTQEVIDAIANLEPSRVICLDAGFQGNDQLKANAVQTFKARARNRETAIEFRTV